MSEWLPVYKLPSLVQLQKWLERDKQMHGEFLSPQQRRRYKLRLEGKPEIEWDADAWKKTGKKERPYPPQIKLLKE